MTRSIRAHLIALLAALVLMLPGSAWARAYYQCRMTGQAMPAPCCHEAKGSVERQAPEARPLDCCARVAPIASSATLATHLTQPDVAPAALAAVMLAPLTAAPLETVLADTLVQARAPPAYRLLPPARAPPR